MMLFILELCHCQHQKAGVRESASSAFLSKRFDKSAALC